MQSNTNNTPLVDCNDQQKRQRLIDVAPIVFGRIRTRLGKDKNPKDIRILLDSGGSGTIIKRNTVKDLRVRKEASTKWTTTAGNFATEGRCVVEFTLPELQRQAMIRHNVHVTDNHMNYDMIIGQDLLEELGIDLKVSTKTIV